MCRTVDVVLAARDFFAEPAIDNPPKRGRRDHLLVGAIITLAVVEWIFNDTMYWPGLYVPMTIALSVTLLWRRSHPLAMFTIAMFGYAVGQCIVGLCGF